MALLFIDGFDANDTAIKWDGVSSTNGTSTTTRFGSGRSFTNSYGAFKTLTPVSTGIVGFATMKSTNYNYVTLCGDGGATAHLGLSTSGTSLVLRAGIHTSAALATSATGSINTSLWNYIEIKATIDNTAGYCEVRVNGAAVITYTGNTNNGGTTTAIDTVIINNETTGLTNYYSAYPLMFDDLYMCDATGPSNNDFLGDVRVQTLVPNAPGTYTSFTPTGSATNWQNVDELPYSVSDYNTSSTTGAKDSYALSDVLADTGSIKGVQNNVIMNKSDSGSASANSFLRVSATDYADPTQLLTASAFSYHAMYNTNPATSAPWSPSDVDGLETGVEVD